MKESKITSTHELMIESKTNDTLKSLIKKYRKLGFRKSSKMQKSEMPNDKRPYFVFMTKKQKL